MSGANSQIFDSETIKDLISPEGKMQTLAVTRHLGGLQLWGLHRARSALTSRDPAPTPDISEQESLSRPFPFSQLSRPSGSFPKGHTESHHPAQGFHS